MGEVIFFENAHAFLDNSSFGIVYKGIEYPTIWHAFESYNLSENAKFELIEKPIQELDIYVHPHRSSITRKPLMLELLKIKFGLQTTTGNKVNQQMMLMKKLLATGIAPLHYGNYHCDTVWGECHCKDHVRTGSSCFGQNFLGEYLTKIRREWRSYIEEINDIPALCDCGKPSATYILYTAEQAPTMPRLLPACENCRDGMMDYAAALSIDGTAILYDLNLELSKPVNNIILLDSGITLPCPKCKNSISKFAYWCPKCGERTVEGFRIMGSMMGEQWPKTEAFSCPVKQSTNERQYKTKVIQC